MRRVTDSDEIAMGHYVTIAYALQVGSVQKLVILKKAPEMKLPGWMSILGLHLSVSISISIFFYVAAIAAGKRLLASLVVLIG